MEWPSDLTVAVAQDGPLAEALRAQGAPVIIGEAPAVLAQVEQRVLCAGHSLRAVLALVAAAGDQREHLALALGDPPARPRRRHLRWWRSLLLWMAADRWFPDSASRLRIYPVAAVHELGCRTHGEGWHDEVLVRAAWHGLPIAEHRIAGRHGPRRTRRRLRPPPVIVTTLRLLARRTLPVRGATGGTASPGRYAAALGLGAAIGVSPLYGLHLLLGGLLAWRLQLNTAVVFLGTNISFGPLMALWPAVAIALGYALREGVAPWRVLQPLITEFRAAEGAAAWWALAAERLADLALGSVVQMVVVGLVVAGSALLAQRVRGARA